jgi:WD40 repeat protein
MMTLLSIPSLLAKFREGTSNGGWLMKSELVLQNKMGAALGQVSSTNKVKQMRIRQDIFSIPGFQMFNWLMPRHIAIPEVYFLLLAMVLGQPVKTLPESVKLDLDSVWNYIFGTSSSEVLNSDLASRVTLCGEAMVAVLCMVRTMLNYETKNPEKLPDWLREYPVTLTQFLFYLYHNVHDFMPVFMGSNVLTALAGTLFPVIASSVPQTPVTSPLGSPVKQVARGTPEKERPELLHLPSKDDSLTNHPAKRNVMNFLRVMVVDSLSLPTSPKQPPAIDSLLDAQPENSSLAQQNRFQTDLLTVIMDHLVAADILIGEQAALPIVPGGSANHIAPNVFYLASRLVDKLWQAVFKKNADEVFQFILKLISQAKRRSGTSMLSLEGIFRCLNRTILYMLSRPIRGVADQMAIMEVLHKLMTNRAILFSRDNPEIEFFGCLTFCLLQLIAGLVIPIDGGNSKTQWHVSPGDGDLGENEAVNQHQGQNLLTTAANRVWEEMFFNKKSAIEEVSKVYFPFGNKTPTLESVRELLQEPTSKVWVQYIEMERKACYQRIPAWEIHTHIQSRIQKVAGGLTGGLKRLTSVSGTSKAKKEEEKKIELSQLPFSEVEASTISHITIVSEVVDQHETQRQQTENHMLKFSEEEWLYTEGQLTRERGLWGPESESRLIKWHLDNTEGPSRMRKRLIRDDMFYYRYPYRTEEGNGEKAYKYKKPTSHDSKLWFERHHNLALFEREEKALELEYDDCDIAVQDQKNNLTIDEQIREIGFKGLKSAPNDIDVDGDDEELEDTQEVEEEKKESVENGDSPSIGTEQQNPNAVEEFSSAYQTVMRLLENGEKIVSMYRIARIQGLDIIEGLLLFGKEHFYLIDGFTIVNHREVHDIEFIPANQYDPIIPTVPGQVPKIKPKREVSKFAFDEVKEVHKRRYLLQPIAVEVFTTNGKNYLLSFQKQFRNKVYQKFSLMATSILENAALSVSGQGRSANVEQATGLFSSLIGETSVTQRWVRSEISNFQYLMSLNTLAGRSYNDLMQYPVFPWILADYDSEELDLTNPKTFRDLSKPMGAQTSQRLDQFKKRYRDWDDAGTDSPPYHYGTHYSSAMIVSSYLVRTEPFTQHFLHLQGGHFDLADRMFHSIGEAWESSSKNNMADVRELIPEFFYLPDFLTNRNNFDLGMKQNGEELNDILLPPWAKNDPKEFIRVHREALESDYVSANLHKWIDLIFGYRQQGDAAIEVANVYHHLFYEGNVDIFSIDDPLQRNATIGFINNFGQIPKQLFKKAHPAKKLSGKGTNGVEVSGAAINSKIFFHNLTNLRPSMAPVKELKGPVGEIQPSERMIYAVEQNKVLVPGNSNRYLAWGFADQSFRLGTYDTDKAVFICEPNYLVGEVLTCVCPNPKLVLTAGTSSVVCVWIYHKKLKQLHLKHSLYGHTDAVTCLAASPGWGIAVSGSRDQTAIIWDLSRFTYIKNLPGHVGPVAAVNINELTGDIVSCAGSMLYLWDVNGTPIASINTAPSSKDKGVVSDASQILCVAQSQFNEWDRQNVILTGSSDGVVRMWSLDYVEVAVDGDSGQQNTPEHEVSLSEVSSITRLAKKMSVSLSGDCLSSLRDAVARQKTQSLHSEASVDEPSSDTEDCEDLETDGPSQMEDLIDGCSPLPENCRSPSLDIEPSVMGSPRKFTPLTSPTTSLKTIAEPPEICVTATGDESFVVINSPVEEAIEVSSPGPAMKPGDGYTWSRQLVFRAKLTMHTAFERSDNTEPAAVTSLAVAKDHRTLFVGDERGRVFSWVVSNKPGKGFVDHWMRDDMTDSCHDCKVRFTIYERRHHCRNCGRLYCSACSRYQAEIPRLKIHQQVRVCRSCYTQLQVSSTVSSSTQPPK